MQFCKKLFSRPLIFIIEKSNAIIRTLASIMTEVKTSILSGERFLNQLVTYNVNKKLTNRTIVFEIIPTVFIYFLHFINITANLKT